MNTMAAFAMGFANRGNEPMVFDWDKAAELIKEKGIRNAGAGLRGDYGNTAGDILSDGEPVMDDYTFLASTWATPMLLIYGDDGWYSEEILCYVMKSMTAWKHDTKCTKSALAILA